MVVHFNKKNYIVDKTKQLSGEILNAISQKLIFEKTLSYYNSNGLYDKFRFENSNGKLKITLKLKEKISSIMSDYHVDEKGKLYKKWNSLRIVQIVFGLLIFFSIIVAIVVYF